MLYENDKTMNVVFLSIFIFISCYISPATAQLWTENQAPRGGWTHFVTVEGLDFSFIRYKQANNVGNGIVLRLDNTNSWAIRYRFKMVFRADSTEFVAPITSGELPAGGTITGDQDGFFWIPFSDNRLITEIGLRGFKVESIDDVNQNIP